MFLLSQSIRMHIASRTPSALVASTLLATGAAALGCSLLRCVGAPLGLALIVALPLAVPAFAIGFVWAFSMSSGADVWLRVGGSGAASCAAACILGSLAG